MHVRITLDTKAFEVWAEGDQDPNLPVGWECRKNAQGRVFYANNIDGTTQWSHPLGEGDAPPGWALGALTLTPFGPRLRV